MKTILITGGSGFLGKGLALALKDNYNIVLSSRNNGLNQIASEETKCTVLPMDVSNPDSIKDVFNQVNPDIVIHAAATKFVDISEKNPFECIDVNIVGSANIARAAIDNGVEIVIGISTDKAAPPINHTYGLSKALLERLFCSLNNNYQTKFSCVRFGNIAWSTGSVFPIWKRMMENENLIQSTGYDMYRYFFSLSDAVNLVIADLENISLTQGRVLLKEMKATKIENILEIWSKKFNVEWVKVPKRPGESLHEVMIGENEIRNTKHIKLGSENFFLISFFEEFDDHIKNTYSTHNSKKLREDEILELISLGF